TRRGAPRLAGAPSLASTARRDSAARHAGQTAPAQPAEAASSIEPSRARLLDERLVQGAHEAIDVRAIAPQRHAQRRHAHRVEWHTRADGALARLVDDARIAADAVPDDRDAALFAELDLIAEHVVEALADLGPVRDIRDREPAAQLFALEIEVSERD